MTKSKNIKRRNVVLIAIFGSILVSLITFSVVQMVRVNALLQEPTSVDVVVASAPVNNSSMVTTTPALHGLQAQEQSKVENQSSITTPPIHINNISQIQQQSQQQQQSQPSQNQNNKYSDIVKDIKLPDNKYRLLHVGKDGGGSIRDRSARAWNLRIQQCHPAPCKRYFAVGNGGGGGSDQTNNTVNLTIPASILTIRDPVDRFVSAFYYRALNIGNNETTRRSKENCTITDPSYNKQKRMKKREQCKQRNMHRSYIFDTYHRNVSMLAERICNESTRAEAMYNASNIGYLLKHKLYDDWLPIKDTFVWTRFEDRIFPTVLEHGFDFDTQIDDAMEWLHSVEPIEEEEAFSIRKRSSRGRVLPNNLKNAHSSTKSATKNIPLSDLGASCLQKYVYTEDYQILKRIGTQTCKTQMCRDAIQSILNRRGVSMT